MSGPAQNSMPQDSIQVHFLTAYPASCLVRGDDGRPKTMTYGGVERARISSAALKRAVRVSDAFQKRFENKLGTRTRRIGSLVADKLTKEGRQEGDVQRAVAEVLEKVLGDFGKRDPESPGSIRQLAFIAPEEVEALATVVRDVLGGKPIPAEAPILRAKVRAVDVALFGRMFAEQTKLRMIAAAEVAHPFTVGRASIEADFYVAVDDKEAEGQETAGGFLSEHFFTAGLFYGYARVDMRQLAANLDGDAALAADAAAAFIEGLTTVSPNGKRASYGTHALASWAMVERGSAPPTSLAAAFLKPVTGADPLAEAGDRAVKLAAAFDRAYGSSWQRRVLDVAAGTGTLAELSALAHDPAPAAS